MSFNIGQFIYLNIHSVDAAEESILYKSRIADISDDLIAMEVPIHNENGKLKRLYVGDSLSAHTITKDGVKHYFNTEVLGFREDTVRLVVIRKPAPDAITKQQRRNFLRVPVELDISIQDPTLHLVAKTEDLSGGGLAFVCDAKYPIRQEQQLSCWLLLPFRNGQIDHVPFQAEIVRVKHREESGQQLAMLKFVQIAEGERQKIVRYCFERQLDFRKK